MNFTWIGIKHEPIYHVLSPTEGFNRYRGENSWFNLTHHITYFAIIGTEFILESVEELSL